jgi:hypothetical protein
MEYLSADVRITSNCILIVLKPFEEIYNFWHILDSCSFSASISFRVVFRLAVQHKPIHFKTPFWTSIWKLILRLRQNRIYIRGEIAVLIKVLKVNFIDRKALNAMQNTKPKQIIRRSPVHDDS